MNPIISARDLSKRFVISHEEQVRYTTLRDVLANQAKKLFSFPKNLRPNERPKQEEFWALKDVNFDIQQGDRVGIIGRNGAGKSTLLKILSRITPPTQGRIDIGGRMSSLLEVGTGFHPELTGRENIFLNGTILGMSRVEIKKKFDEIVAFAEVERFIDTPIKRYSSGMDVRLAFSVAAHLEPEILVIDEVLAVGDAQFQKKCLGKMEDVSKQGGRTILFVSHQMTAMQSFCNKGIMLERGKLFHDGDIGSTISTYLNQFADSSSRMVEYTEQDAPGNDKAKLLRAHVYHPDKNVDRFEMGDAVMLEFAFLNLTTEKSVLDVTFHLTDEMGNTVFVGSTAHFYEDFNWFGKGKIHFKCKVPPHLLHEGSYNINRLILERDRGGLVILELRDVIQFEVLAGQKEQFNGNMGKQGVVRPMLEWEMMSA